MDLAFSQQPNRLPPQGTPDQYRTFQVATPIATHTRSASCAEVECEAQARGWRSVIDTTTELGQKQSAYIRGLSGRSFKMEDGGAPGLVAFVFPAGQECFAEHRVSIDRPALFVVREGDWRGNPRGVQPRLVDQDEWVDTFATHQQLLADKLKEG